MQTESDPEKFIANLGLISLNRLGEDHNNNMEKVLASIIRDKYQNGFTFLY